MKSLIGGSPCTHWSIAQTKHRETEPSGLGWELFLNYLIAREKYRPDYFLYENNKSMSPAIRAQITRELGVEPILINSALVSAQSRRKVEKEEKACATCGNLVRIGGTLIGCVAHDKLILPNYPPYFGQKPCPDWKP